MFFERSYISKLHLRIAVTFFLPGLALPLCILRIGYFASRILQLRLVRFCELIERFRDEREGEFDGADDEGHERVERAEREALRQDRVDVAKLSPARREAQLHPVAFGWS